MFESKPRSFQNPVELALSQADVVLNYQADKIAIEATVEEERALVELDKKAEELGFFDKYLVESTQSFAAPSSYQKDEAVRLISFKDGLTFYGDFINHASFKFNYLERIKGDSLNIRALCLVFDSLILLPFFDKLPPNYLLYTPAYAIEDIRQKTGEKCSSSEELF